MSKHIVEIIDEAMAKKVMRKWKKLYWAIDLHNTILPSSRTKGTHDILDIYPGCLLTLKELTRAPEHCPILFTSTYPTDLQPFLKTLDEEFGIEFDYVNENPECFDSPYADFSNKFYYDILLDDKAGFDPHHDWNHISMWLSNERLVKAAERIEENL